MFFSKQVLKRVAYIVVISYISLLNASNLAAAEVQHASSKSLLLAQTSLNPATSESVSADEERALEQIYNEKIQRLEADMNSARGTRNTLLTVAVTSFFLGAGITAGSTTVRNAIDDIEIENEQEQENKEDAVEALEAMNGIGAGIIGAGGLCILGYLTYTSLIHSKQKKIDTLRDELDARFAVRGLTPEYLRKNESVAFVLDEIADTKKSAGTSKSFQGFFSRIAIGSLLSGGILFVLGSAGEGVIDEVEINEEDEEERASRDKAYDQADNIKTTGIILLGAGGACGIASFIFGRRASGKEKRIDELENSLLRVAERIDFQPKPNGFALMYSYAF
jgi:hypothetical protein